MHGFIPSHNAALNVSLTPNRASTSIAVRRDMKNGQHRCAFAPGRTQRYENNQQPEHKIAVDFTLLERRVEDILGDAIPSCQNGVLQPRQRPEISSQKRVSISLNLGRETNGLGLWLESSLCQVGLVVDQQSPDRFSILLMDRREELVNQQLFSSKGRRQ